jgi:hypothetical protein
MSDVEDWRPVPSFPDYHVSNLGRVRSPRKILRTCPRANGYLVVNLGRKNHRRVHRIVMEAFHGPSLLHVNHKNFDRQDNRLCNLEYTTQADNNRHMIYSGRRDAAYARSRKVPDSEVATIRASKEPHSELAARYGVSQSLISMIQRGLRRSKARIDAQPVA